MTDTSLDKLFETLRSLTSRKHPPQPLVEAQPKATFLIVGLGNPGREYRETRHNIGFLVTDQIAHRLGVEFSRTRSKALITEGLHQGRKVILAKPQSYMNRSGHPTRSLVRFYKIPLEHILIVYDDVDLPFATMRMKPSGGPGGHKGMGSVIEQLGTQAIPRLRLGVGRPPGYKQTASYVLKPFNAEEKAFLPAFLDRAADAVFAFLTEGIQHAMTLYNRNA